MLVKFKVENWKSFHCLDFSAIASQEENFSYRVSELSDYPVKILPISAVFGGNASGKSNFVEALSFLQKLVRGKGGVGDKIDIKPFAFNRAERVKPVSFEIEFLVESKIYHYELVASYERILVECLAEVNYDASLKYYFKREGDKIELSEEFEAGRLKCVGEGTQDRVLFLTNSVQQRCEEFHHIYDWFDKTLLLILPNSRVRPSHVLLDSEFGELLDLFDVGFDELGEVDMTVEQIVQEMQDHNVPKDLQKSLIGQFESALTKVRSSSIQDKQVQFSKIVAMHTMEDDFEKIPFELENESDGTRRLLDLLPVLIKLRNSSQPQVVFIDEIDRSMHHLLTRSLIRFYLDECTSESRSQLFFTTHDALLLDDKLMRHDEMWLLERNEAASDLTSVGDFKIRKGSKLLDSYLRGRLGGIPNIRLI